MIKQDCIPVGCIPPACWPYLPACTAQGGVCSRELVSALGGAWLRGCLVCGGVRSWGGACCGRGWYSCVHWGRSPLWTEFLTHATENITLPQTSFAGGKYLKLMIPTSLKIVISWIFTAFSCSGWFTGTTVRADNGCSWRSAGRRRTIYRPCSSTWNPSASRDLLYRTKGEVLLQLVSTSIQENPDSLKFGIPAKIAFR